MDGGHRRVKEHGSRYHSKPTGHSFVKTQPDDRRRRKHSRVDNVDEEPDDRKHRKHSRVDNADEGRSGRRQQREQKVQPRSEGYDRRDSRHKRDVQNIQKQTSERQFHDRKRRHARRERDDLEGPDVWGQAGDGDGDDSGEPQEKEKPNFEVSGKLTEDTNTYRGVVIKYNEPPEARKTRKKWRLYIFKGDKTLPMLPVHRQSAYLLGRDRKVADIPIDHPSCSKQHAVFQYRLVEYNRADGSTGRRVSPYIIDLNSANGTYVNNTRIDSQRYVELMEKDVIKFGFSSREYVLLHDQVKAGDDEEDEAEHSEGQHE